MILILILILVLVLLIVIAVLAVLILRRFLQLLQHFIDIMLQLFCLGAVAVIIHGTGASMGGEYGSCRTQGLNGIVQLLLRREIVKVDLLDHGQGKVDPNGTFLSFRGFLCQGLLVIGDGPGVIPFLIRHISQIVIGKIAFHDVHIGELYLRLRFIVPGFIGGDKPAVHIITNAQI